MGGTAVFLVGAFPGIDRLQKYEIASLFLQSAHHGVVIVIYDEQL